MICDWIGAGKAYNKGKWTVDSFKVWYNNNKDLLILHTEVRRCIDEVILYSTTEEDLYRYTNPNHLAFWYADDMRLGICNYKPDTYDIK